VKLRTLRLSGFQSFAPDPPTAIDLDELAVLVGLNGAGKTAVITALARMFGVDRRMRGLRPSDFYAPPQAANPASGGERGENAREREGASRSLWIEAEFHFPELRDGGGARPGVAHHFLRMTVAPGTADPIVRIRLEGELSPEGDIEEELCFITMLDANGEPQSKVRLKAAERNQIHVHYVPAARDPGSQIDYAPSTLLGRLLRAAQWDATVRGTIQRASDQIATAVAAHPAIGAIDNAVSEAWGQVHKGNFLKRPHLSFPWGEVENLLNQVTIMFAPGEAAPKVEYARLSDGQRSLLHMALVHAVLRIEQKALAEAGSNDAAFPLDRLRPPVYTLLAVEEPENHLAPHYLGRICSVLSEIARTTNGQVLISSHSPSILRRVEPRHVRHLRLATPDRRTVVQTITLPSESAEAYKYVREAVQAFPELYFARLVVLGEGDSEEIVLPKVLRTCGHDIDDGFLSVVPLGGRHVNHFWRLLSNLGIPYVTLLDLDYGRHQGGWGRIRYAAKQLLEHSPDPAGLPFTEADVDALPKWNSSDNPWTSRLGSQWREMLMHCGVFFSGPLDLDFMMLSAFPDAYDVQDEEAEAVDVKLAASVLGEKGLGAEVYSSLEQELFAPYQTRFKGKSKPASHLEAMSRLDPGDLEAHLPAPLSNLASVVEVKLTALPE
jgi:putative ATP-dependent endonuclease of the OLD family